MEFLVSITWNESHTRILAQGMNLGLWSGVEVRERALRVFFVQWEREREAKEDEDPLLYGGLKKSRWWTVGGLTVTDGQDDRH